MAKSEAKKHDHENDKPEGKPESNGNGIGSIFGEEESKRKHFPEKVCPFCGYVMKVYHTRGIVQYVKCLGKVGDDGKQLPGCGLTTTVERRVIPND